MQIIAGDRCACVVAMDPELVRAPGERLELHEIVRTVALDSAKGRPRRPSGVVDGESRNTVPRSPDRGVDHPDVVGEMSADEREVLFCYAPIAKRARESVVRVERLRDDERAGRSLIESVDQERP